MVPLRCMVTSQPCVRLDSLSTRRVYKREWNLAEAVRFVMSGSGTQFQPDLVDAFVKVMVARHPELAAELG